MDNIMLIEWLSKFCDIQYYVREINNRLSLLHTCIFYDLFYIAPFTFLPPHR